MQTAPAAPLVPKQRAVRVRLDLAARQFSPPPTAHGIAGFWGSARLARPSLYVSSQLRDAERFGPQGCEVLRLRCAAASRNREEKNIMDASKIKMAYSISERNGKSYFNKVGIGFVNKDGSWNLKLESFPISGEIHIRDYVPREDGDAPGATRTRGNAQTRAAAAE
jgi:hypothetical protein